MIKYIVVFLFSINTLTLASQCNGRYQSDIFSEVEISTEKYGANIDYKNDSVQLYLDIYKPKNDTFSKRPCVVFCFGGAFIQGSRTSVELVYMATDLAKKGYVCVSIDYRLDNALNLLNSLASSKAVIRAVQDAKAAVRYVKFNNQILKIDTNQIFIGGTSAGGVTAMTLGYSQYDEYSPVIKSAIDGLGGIEGTTNILVNSSKVKGLFNFSGGIGDTTHIGIKDLPIYLNHSNGDQTVPFRSGYPLSGVSPNILHGSFNIMLRMKNQGGYAVLDSFNSSAHPSFTNQTEVSNTTLSLKNFLYTQLSCNNSQSSALDELKNEEISFYPNPVENIITIEGNKSQKYQVEIVDVLGKKVFTQFSNESKLDISNVEKGCYFITINNQRPKKLIKN